MRYVWLRYPWAFRGFHRTLYQLGVLMPDMGHRSDRELRRMEHQEQLREGRTPSAPSPSAPIPEARIDPRIMAAVHAAVERGGPLEDDAEIRDLVQHLARRARAKRHERGAAHQLIRTHLWRAGHRSSLEPAERQRAATAIVEQLGAWIEAVWPLGVRDPDG